MDEINGFSSLHILLGRVLERSEQTIDRLDRIDARLVRGDQTMGDLDHRLTTLEGARKEAPAHSIKDTISTIERIGKLVMAWLLPPLVLAMTGSLEKAIQFLSLMK